MKVDWKRVIVGGLMAAVVAGCEAGPRDPVSTESNVQHPGDPDALLAEDTSVTTGRTLDEIASSRRSRVWQSKPAHKTRFGNGARSAVAPAHVKKKRPSPGRGARGRKSPT